MKSVWMKLSASRNRRMKKTDIEKEIKELENELGDSQK